MEHESNSSILKHFSTLKDPRVKNRNDHKSIDIVVIAICGIICEADDWAAISAFGKAKHDWFKTFLELPNGIPISWHI